MKEETNLDVAVKGLFLDGPEVHKDSPDQRHLAYLCEAMNGEARPGAEPELAEESHFRIDDVRWFDLRSEAEWDPKAADDPMTCQFLQLVRRKLGYLPEA